MDPQQDAVQGDADHSSEGLGSFDDDDEMDNDDSRGNNGQPRAKKRRKYINKACDNCRTRHSRCDGKEPCGPCAKKGFPCGYSAPPSRRGPVSERQLQELITSLTKQIESEKKMKKVCTLTPPPPNARWDGSIHFLGFSWPSFFNLLCSALPPIG